MVFMQASYLLKIEISHDAGGIEYHLAAASKKKPLRQGRRGLLL
jgi:hypothetical protein